MFERYTEKARRVIFFARYEASQFGSPYIETEHLLLGLLREEKALTNRFLRSHTVVESIRKQIEAHTTIREKVPASADLPLSNESKRVLAYAAEETERLGHKHIGSEHLLLGLLREEKCFAGELLKDIGLKIAAVRDDLVRTPHTTAAGSSPKPTPLAEFSRDLTQAAMDGELDPVVGRDEELNAIIEVLGSRLISNPVLVGDHGVGKTAIVEGLAQRIADGEVPSFLADKRILAFDNQLLVGWTKDRQKMEERLNMIAKALKDTDDVIMCIDELSGLFGGGSVSGSLDAAEIFRPALLRGAIQCICACTPGDYRASTQVFPWLGHCLRIVNVLPLDEERTLRVLTVRKDQYEKFHGVSYTNEALRHAARCSVLYFPNGPLPVKAFELLDAAGSRVKLRQESQPDEVVELQKRIKFIVHRMDSAIANHEFEKARFYADEERKERGNLRVLREKHNLDDSLIGVVNREDVDKVVSRWTGPAISSAGDGHTTGRSGSDVSSAAPTTPSRNERGPNLSVFLCHSSKDKPAVRELYARLKEGHFDPWLDEEDLLPGQEWEFEITNAVRSCQVVVVCLSPDSVSKAGYLQREIKKVLDVADEQPEGTIYVIPLKLAECEVPSRLRRWHWVSMFEAKGFERLVLALRERAHAVGLQLP
jgi:ATP-dependent Clp protease ATP-binding subunit ClpC